MDVIKVENLKKYYGDVKAVDGISFEVKEGEIYGFLGPNGAGKTTTIRCMMDFLRPDSGQIQILGKDSHTDYIKIKDVIGFLPGEVNLYENNNGWDHINLIRNIRNIKDGIGELIEKFQFDPNKKVKKLSTGNLQKLGLIMALMHDPKLLILDEPTAGLDPLLQQTLYDLLKKRAKEGCTVFFSSHNLAEVEKLCDKVCILKEGKIVSVEYVKDLKQKQLYQVEVYFKDKLPKGLVVTLEKAGMEILEQYKDGVLFKVRSSIDKTLDILEKHSIRDIEIRHASLEDVLFEFYK